MDILADLAASGAPEGTTVLAGFQETGRGRADRRWVVPPDRAVLASVLLCPGVPLPRLMPLSLLVADAIRESVTSLYGLDPQIKWPNDLLIGGRKLSGVLIQTRHMSRSHRLPSLKAAVIPSAVEGSLIQTDGQPGQSKNPVVMVGMGINANVSPDDLPPMGTSILAETGREVNRDELLRTVLDALYERYRELVEDRLENRWQRLRRHLAMLDEEVVVEDAGRRITGILSGVDRDGTLILRDGSGERRIAAGDLSRGPRPVSRGGIQAEPGKPGILP